ncbi:MAG: phosphomethylpyrimidine synthase ThiC [Thermodesulfobacteriota bacterium]|nr:phosphomethylpyrimidine synthase ThiC [Thermodesulfobacteriota bacterium]
MLTQMERANRGVITPEIDHCAKIEGVCPKCIMDGVATGNVVLTKNRVRKKEIIPTIIGKGFPTKVNVNLGTSPDHLCIEEEIEKLKTAIKYGADTVMDLSIGGSIDEMRRTILDESTVPVGTVPIYQAAIETVRNKKKAMVEMTPSDIFSVIEKHAEDGVDFITVHCGVTRESVEKLSKDKRLMDIVSRGGAFTVEWMAYNNKENPLYEYYDQLVQLAKAYDIVLSLGDGLRPGSLSDASDRGQIQELIILGELTERAWAEGVQVIIEGPGHMPLNQIEANVFLQKKLCRGAPFYVLGPLVTDIAPGHDHIVSAIGGAIAAFAGADFLCCVTPSEHLRLPTAHDIYQGVIASKIAAHAADIAKGIKGSLDKDIHMAKSRKKLDWEGQFDAALDPEGAKKIHEKSNLLEDAVCTMCGEFCAIKVMDRARSGVVP